MASSEELMQHPVKDTVLFPAAQPTATAAATLEAWHRAVDLAMTGGSKGDAMAVLAPHVSEAVVFKPPTYLKPWQGAPAFLLLIETVSEVFGESFQYRRKWISPDGRDWCLEFTATVQGKPLTGVDLVQLDSDGNICHFEVLARPPAAVKALKEEMGRRVPAKIAARQEQQEQSNSKL
eukprot:TRINITY_DN100757_c0_g1_i1.p1 TRINITY_DN100757_c0_g1~~TRINITY_DN100757_c0_g1_i1.p1  ORF type:complete len:178 (-),score=40.21 TRINITY_DN100757_c0_g1_i1:290-823(-)